jgi:hypothetical protein
MEEQNVRGLRRVDRGDLTGVMQGEMRSVWNQKRRSVFVGETEGSGDSNLKGHGELLVKTGHGMGGRQRRQDRPRAGGGRLSSN